MRLPSKSTTFVVLMLVSALGAFVLPSDWTDWLRSPFQLRGLLQLSMTWGGRSVRTAFSNLDGVPLTPDQVREILREHAALQRQVGQQELRLIEQQQLLDALTALRGQSPDGLTAVVIGTVIAYDADPRRETIQVLLSGAARGYVETGQWVAAGAWETPTRAGVARQWLVGTVSEVHSQLVRVRLTTDPAFATEVKVARVLADGTWQTAQPACELRGVGRGRMEIRAAEEDYFTSGYRVVVAPRSPQLPMSLSVGRVEGARQRDDSSLHFDLTVVPWEPAQDLRYVYILVTRP